MLRPLAAAAVLVLGALLAACTATSPTTNGPTLDPPSAAPTGEPSGSGGGGILPACELVAAAVFGLVDPLEFDSAASLSQEAQEEYDQRVCVYRSADGTAAIGITIAAIPFQQTELDGYAARPNALSDARLEARHAVLQTFEAGDGDDGFLDSPLYLIDTSWSVTIQGVTEDSTVAVLLPQLTVTTATDAAFAVRDLVG